MIRNVCIHVNNEQPLIADLYAVPTAADAGLLCTNLRMTDGKRPIFIDRIDATFFFPYHVVRFIEIPVGALEGHATASAAGGANGLLAGTDLIDELRLPVVVPNPDGDTEDDGDLELEIDEGFLQRIRDI